MTNQNSTLSFRVSAGLKNIIGRDLISDKLSRLMECISVKENDSSMHLLCDDNRSLMRTMYNSTLVMMRSYEFPADTPV